MPIVLFFRLEPHAVIPRWHLFVGRQEVRIGVTLIIQPSLTPPCQFWFSTDFHVFDNNFPVLLHIVACWRNYSRCRGFPIWAVNSRYLRNNKYNGSSPVRWAAFNNVEKQEPTQESTRTNIICKTSQESRNCPLGKESFIAGKALLKERL